MTSDPIHRAVAIRLAVTAAYTALTLVTVVCWVALKNLALRVQDQAMAKDR